MALVVNTNIASMRSLGYMSQTQRSLESTFERVSSGRRINSAKDDAAGLAVAENLDATYRSLQAAGRNVNDALGVVQVAEGAVSEVSNILKRMRELSIQSATGTLADAERAYLQDEVQQLRSEIDRLASSTNFNGVSLADSNATALTFHIGAGSSTTLDQIVMSLGVLRASAIALDGGTNTGDVSTVDISTAAGALTAMTNIDNALDAVNEIRAHYGGVANRLESAGRSIDIYSTNLKASESQIRDADFAAESAELSKLQVLQQSGIAILGQANGLPQAALRLIG